MTTRSIEIPITELPWPILTVDIPMTGREWNQMMDMLEMMKPALLFNSKPYMVNWDYSISRG